MRSIRLLVARALVAGVIVSVLLPMAAAHAAVPQKPTNVQATAGDTQATVTWSAPTSDSPINGYTVTSNPGSLTASVNGDTLSATVTGLTNGTAYTFTVVASSAEGFGASSDPSGAVTPAGVPTAPSNVQATAGNGQATVTWTASSSNGSTITGYTVTSSPGAFTAPVAGDVTEATVTGLTNGTEYTFTVVATNARGNSSASAASASVTPAGVPGRRRV